MWAKVVQAVVGLVAVIVPALRKPKHERAPEPEPQPEPPPKPKRPIKVRSNAK